MSTPHLQSLLGNIRRNAQLTEGDVIAMRREVFADNTISIDEADALFEINNLSGKPDVWNDLFIHTITTFLVRQTMPHGYVNQANAAWLMARIDHDGAVETHTELELLLTVMDRADNVTQELEMYALAQVKQAVLHGTGYLGRGHPLQPGIIGEAEVKVLRRILYAASGEGGSGIGRREAELLFDLNDVMGEADNHESWKRLFVGGVANHLMMVAAWQAPDANEALRREQWLEQPSPGFLRSALGNLGNMGKVRDAFTAPSINSQASYSHTNTANVMEAERITGGEAAWLIERLNRDGKLCTNERALLQFLEEESPDVHGSLLPYLHAA